MPTITYLNETFSCSHACKGPDFIELLDANGKVTYLFESISDFSMFTITDGSWEMPRGAEETRADASLVSGNIVLTCEKRVGHGTLVKFVAPCHCAAVTGGLVVGENTYSIVNSLGSVVTGLGGTWQAGSIIAVVIDTTNMQAFIQNAPDAVCGITGGDSLALTLASPGFTLVDGIKIKFKLGSDMASGATIDVNGTGAKPLQNSDGRAVKPGAPSGSWHEAIYSSTTDSFTLLGKGGDSGNSVAGTLCHSQTFEAVMGWTLVPAQFNMLHNN